MTRPLIRVRQALVPLAMALLMQGAHGGEHERPARVAPLPLYTQECGGCHMAYPPGLLPAASWKRQLDGLGHHYGTDASLESGDARLIGQWLAAHADERRTWAPPPDDRITRTDWFVRKHRRIDTDTWRLPSVRSASNCIACHPAADRGRFSEHDLRMPEGLGARQRSAWDD